MVIKPLAIVATVSVLGCLTLLALKSTPSFVSLQETSAEMHAKENSFFDLLAAKDAAKSHQSNGEHPKRKSPGFSSIRGQFKSEQRKLAQEKVKMHHMEESDRVSAAKQTLKMERLSAHEQALEYERHLAKLADSVLPSSERGQLDPADSVRLEFPLLCFPPTLLPLPDICVLQECLGR